ncbi:MAG: caspase family protein, partial [Planctomycetes bacterium]|nr:caspase family protein [Planctomycetota bacterium]
MTVSGGSEQEYFARALRAVNAILWSPRASSAERAAAREAREDLREEFVDQRVDDIEAGAEQFRAFVARVRQLILQIGAASRIAGVDALRKIADEASAASERAPSGRGRSPVDGLRVLCVHGIGDHHTDLSWELQWQDAILAGLRRWRPHQDATFEFPLYDDIFERHPLDAATIAEAVWKLGVSGIVHGIGDLFRRTRGLEDVSAGLRWTAGMVAQWASDDDLREEARRRILAAIRAFDPRIVCAHSLGSLICYDAFLSEPGLMAGRSFLSFGSQIGHPFVRNTLGGRIVAIDSSATWNHLYNRYDDAFTAHLRIAADNFIEIETDFDVSGFLDHDPVEYLSHPNTVNTVWRALADVTPRGLARSVAAFRRVARRPKRRALLVGINEYPNPANRLDGCVNDVFLASSVLQECGFEAKDVRIVLDDRATAAAILDRLHWLLDGVTSGEERVFFYSGHGAQIPAYGVRDEVDHFDECLVPWDFDWTREKAILDDQFFDLYSQLPYDSSFVAVLDCCHSGGMARAGAPKVRGIDPPDDIRHRALEWSRSRSQWTDRILGQATREVAVRKDARA